MNLILMQFVSVDGVCQGPGAPDEDTSGGFDRGGWLVPYVDEEFLRIVTEWTLRADAFLFGRRTYENFARDWPKAEPGDPVGDRLNGRPKYVATQTLTSAGWAPSTILSGDVAARVAELKQQPGGEIQIHGSATLGRSLLAAGLIDEVRLLIAPVYVGTGRRLMADAPATGLKLTSHTTTAAGVAVHTYTPTGPADYGSYGL